MIMKFETKIEYISILYLILLFYICVTVFYIHLKLNELILVKNVKNVLFNFKIVITNKFIIFVVP